MDVDHGAAAGASSCGRRNAGNRDGRDSRALQKINSEIVVFEIMTMDQIVSESLAVRRFAMILLSVFAAIALLLASIGIYGVISY